MSILNRTEYKALKAADYLDAARSADVPCTEEDARAEVKGQYPKDTAAAIAELNERGLAATPWRIERLCRDPELAPP